MNLTVTSERELSGLAKEILNYAQNINIFILVGDLGVGKTSLIKKMCERLGVKEKTNSPTYNIVNEYLANPLPIYHMDLYRLKNMEEVYEIGIEEYLDSDSFCFIEWPDLIRPILSTSYIEITIFKKEENQRVFSLKKIINP